VSKRRIPALTFPPPSARKRAICSVVSVTVIATNGDGPSALRPAPFRAPPCLVANAELEPPPREKARHQPLVPPALVHAGDVGRGAEPRRVGLREAKGIAFGLSSADDLGTLAGSGNAEGCEAEVLGSGEVHGMNVSCEIKYVNPPIPQGSEVGAEEALAWRRAA
jgi:hypothetical protein